MASILDRYGIKEVADVVFCKINEDGTRGAPVLYLDTLKVSTIEQTAETSDARGGKGNPKLVSWDYGKEINVSLEDALFSAKSMSIMFGDGETPAEAVKNVTRTAVMRVSGDADYFVADMYDEKTKGSVRKKVWFGTKPAGQEGEQFDAVKSKLANVRVYDEASNPLKSGNAFASESEWTNIRSTYVGQKVFVTYEVEAKSRTINISGDSFPGTYYIAGDTYARSDVTGADQFFQFIIPKAKVTSENTITLEAEGDPAVFNMSLTVLRPDDGIMMQLVQYTLDNPGEG
jgi:hypothetical protein